MKAGASSQGAAAAVVECRFWSSLGSRSLRVGLSGELVHDASKQAMYPATMGEIGSTDEKGHVMGERAWAVRWVVEASSAKQSGNDVEVRNAGLEELGIGKRNEWRFEREEV
ncbi:hypothetical protein Landi51_06327 [Colletotrichum acutatum]